MMCALLTYASTGMSSQPSDFDDREHPKLAPAQRPTFSRCYFFFEVTIGK
jgi:hypothetical protein